jgi:hypothetical protein
MVEANVENRGLWWIRSSVHLSGPYLCHCQRLDHFGLLQHGLLWVCYDHVLDVEANLLIDSQEAGGSALAYKQTQLDSSDITTETCLSTCKQQGFPLAGTMYADECYCGNVLGNGRKQNLPLRTPYILLTAIRNGSHSRFRL